MTLARIQNSFRSSSPITNEQILKYAPSVLADAPHESRGPRYTFIPTLAVLDGLRKEGFQPYEVRQTRTIHEGRRASARHVIRLRHDSQAVQGRVVGDEWPEIILMNSHDGTSSYQLMSGFFRLVCSNGMVAGDTNENIRIRHSGNVIDNVIEGSYEVLNNLQEISRHVDEFKAIQLLPQEQLLLARAAIPLRFDTPEGETSPVSAESILKPRRYEDNKRDLWTTFNTIQENLVKGGLKTRSKTGRTNRTKEVNGINENVKLNRALWQLAEGMASIKTAV